MIKAEDLIRYFQTAQAENWGYIWGSHGELWTENKQKALVNKFISAYGSGWKSNSEAKDNDRYRSALYGGKWAGHKVADCSGLFRDAFEKLGGAIAHGSNTIWKSYCSRKGKLEPGMDLRPGTAVFTGTEDKKPHIGLYIGGGKVIEAKGTEAGVIESSITDPKWKFWGELKDVAYDGEVPEPVGMPTIRKGSSGEYVTLLQTKLINRGYDCGRSGADGKYGENTRRAVIRFQEAVGLAPDGICGPLTWAALLDDVPEEFYTVTISHLIKHKAEELAKMYPGAVIQAEGSDA